MKKIIFKTLILILFANYGFSQTNWQEITGPPGSSLNRVQFYDELNGYVIANETKLYKTIDGAESWTYLNIDMGLGGKVGNFHLFGDNTTLIATGLNYTQEYGRIFKSTDGGDNWEIKLELDLRYFKGVYFLNQTVGWAWSEKYPNSYLYRTDDQGETWTEIYITSKKLMNLFFLDENVGWRCSRAGGHVAKTEDGGYTWVDQLNATGVGGINDVFFLDEQMGYAAGDDRALLKTMDGGVNWEFLSSANDPGILPPESATDWAVLDIHFIDENVGWIIGGPC